MVAQDGGRAVLDLEWIGSEKDKNQERRTGRRKKEKEDK